MSRGRLVDVHFTRPPFGPLTYRVPEGAAVAAGCRVVVELGAGTAVGLAGDGAGRPPRRVTVKEILRVLDLEPFVPAPTWALFAFVARRFAASLGETARVALPVPLDLSHDDVVILSAAFARAPTAAGLDNEEAAALGAIWEAGWLSARAVPPRVLRRLHARGVVVVEPYTSRPALADVLVFSAEGGRGRLGRLGAAVAAELAAGPVGAARYFGVARKRDALRRLLRARRALLAAAAGTRGPAVTLPASRVLLTGGGGGRQLTAALEEVRRLGAERVLVIVPRIYRIAAARRRCEEVWGGPFAAYTSEMSRTARWELFRRCARGTVARVVGTPAALFLPIAGDAAVIMLEEEDNAYKQWERAPYFHARDVAWARARRAPLVMTARTPSLEVYVDAAAGATRWRELLPRARAARGVTIVDMAQVVAAEGPVILSAALVAALGDTLAAGGRAAVFVNRRGYIPYIYCGTCGRALRCSSCDAALTYYKEEAALRCHYCMRYEPLPPRCPSCGKATLVGVGFGVEKLVSEVKLAFPAARVARVDSAALATPARVRRFWLEYAAGAYDVVVGTQMALRALEAPQVKLAALASADTAMNLPDFRAAEQTFRTVRDLLERRPADCRVIVQTFYAGHYAIAAAAAGDYDAFARAELAFRRRLNLPPYCHLVNVVVSGRARKATAAAAARVRSRLEGILGDAAELLGPAPAPLARLRGVFREQILVKTTEEAIAERGAALAALVRRKGRLAVTVDVDPYELF